MKPKIFIGSDHAGYELKLSIREYLEEQGYKVEDMGPKDYRKGDDYPSFIIPTAEKVSNNKNSRGIVLGHSGQGEAIASNKVEGIRAAVYYGGQEDILELSRRHNQANVLSLGAGFLSEKEALEAVEKWINTDFNGEKRHQRRIDEVRSYESRTDPLVLPAILAEGSDEMEEELEKVLPYSRWFHLDIEDGKFVENSSLDFDFDLPEGQYYEAHLMVENPFKYIKENLDRFEAFNFHIESCSNPEKIIAFLKDRGKKAGIAINPDTDIEEVLDYSHDVDRIQVMTVEPGEYGSEFHSEMIDRIQSIREENPWLDIEVDGHVTGENILELREAGANIFVSGSYLQGSEHPGEAVEKLETEINKYRESR